MLFRECAAKHTVLEFNPFVRSPSFSRLSDSRTLFKQKSAKLGGQTKKRFILEIYRAFWIIKSYEAAAALDSRMKSEALKLNLNLNKQTS